MTVDALPPLTFVLGGARSGKSAYAERIVLQCGLDPVYLATAEGLDDEMAARIAQHRESRDARFRTVEVPLELADAIRQESRPERALLVDCLTLWLTNLMVAERDLESACDDLLGACRDAAGPVVLVSNEVGLGVVPVDRMSRAFVDSAGRLHRALAQAADDVVFLTAGLARRLK